MQKIVWVVVALLLNVGAAFALEVTSMAPDRGAPGTLVALGGGPFSGETEPFLGEQYVAPLRVTDNRLEFTVPFLPPGRYTLTVQDNTTVAAESYAFEVLAPTPRLTAIDPSNLDVCSADSTKQVQVSGRNFMPGAVLLVNEKVVPSKVISTNRIDAQLPRLTEPGVYGVAVRNPDGAISLPHSLWVDSIPEITSVEAGDEFVNYYEVIIRGKNFQFNSTLVVKEPEESMVGQAYRQFSFNSRQGPRSQSSEIIAPRRDRLIYVDCQTLIYHRYASNFQSREVGLQVFNPDGRTTGMYFATLP